MSKNVEMSVSNSRAIIDVIPGIFSKLSAMENILNQRANPSPTHTHLSFRIMTHYLVPSSPHPAFASIEPVLAELHNRFTAGNRPSERILTLTGESCGGKTRAALEFCLRSKDNQAFGAIFWITASSQKTLDTSFRKIASILNISSSLPLTDRIATTLTVLASWPTPWLIVFDNCPKEDVREELQKFMVNTEQGSYLITRKANSFSQADESSILKLPELALQDAVELLFLKSEMAKSDANYEDAVRLVRVLGKSPRAVVAAGMFLKKRRMGFAEYSQHVST
jgi:hypothetical protein